MSNCCYMLQLAFWLESDLESNFESWLNRTKQFEYTLLIQILKYASISSNIWEISWKVLFEFLFPRINCIIMEIHLWRLCTIVVNIKGFKGQRNTSSRPQISQKIKLQGKIIFSSPYLLLFLFDILYLDNVRNGCHYNKCVLLEKFPRKIISGWYGTTIT